MSGKQANLDSVFSIVTVGTGLGSGLCGSIDDVVVRELRQESVVNEQLLKIRKK